MAQLLSLPGLDLLLSALAPHAGRPWPTDLMPAIERIRRVAMRCAVAGDLEQFRASEADLESLASELGALEWSPPPRGGSGAPAISTLSAADALGDLPLADEDAATIARRVRLATPVAAALRAALDWLSGEGGPRRPLGLHADEGMLEVSCEPLDAAGIMPAHEVLAAVEGNLGPSPAAGPEGALTRAWIVRVPAHVPRGSYIMLEQGELRLAVPWHAVLRLAVAPREQIEARGARLGVPLLEPLSPLAHPAAEGPLVLVGHGLKRGWLTADRLVWRLPAEPCELETAARDRGFLRAVRTDDGEVYCVATPGLLLGGVALPPLPDLPRLPHLRRAETPAGRPPAVVAPRAETPPAPAAPLVELRAPAEPPAPPVKPKAAAAPPELREPLAPRAAAAVAPPEVLSEAWVTPLGVLEAPEPAADVARPRRALVAEDSFVARTFLIRLLEQQGFEVSGVERAADLMSALARGPWHLLCVDVELPDARGAALLGAVLARRPPGAALVALVRDHEDAAVAAKAGIRRTLLKPVDRQSLDRLLALTGLAARDGAS